MKMKTLFYTCAVINLWYSSTKPVPLSIIIRGWPEPAQSSICFLHSKQPMLWLPTSPDQVSSEYSANAWTVGKNLLLHCCVFGFSPSKDPQSFLTNGHTQSKCVTISGSCLQNFKKLNSPYFVLNNSFSTKIKKKIDTHDTKLDTN